MKSHHHCSEYSQTLKRNPFCFYCFIHHPPHLHVQFCVKIVSLSKKKKNKREVSSSLERPMQKDLWLIHKTLIKLNGLAWMGLTRTGNWNINGFYWSHKPNSCNKKLTSFSSHEKSESEDARLSHSAWMDNVTNVMNESVGTSAHRVRSNRTHAPLSPP